jgi:predicted nucleic acid-binding protein
VNSIVLTIRWIDKFGDDPKSLTKLSQSSKTMMTILTAVLDIVDPKPPYSAWDEPRDPDDNHLYCAAVECSADFVISENTTDFPPNGAYAGITYLTSAQLSKHLESSGGS